MRPLQCHAGFPVPLGVGKYEVCGIHAVVETPSAASRITIIDDNDLPRNAVQGRILADDNQKVPIIDIKGIADADGQLTEYFYEPVKFNYGASVINASNLKGGRVMLFIR